MPYPDFENPSDGITPEFNQLRCSLLPKQMSQQRRRETRAAAGDIDWYPPYAGGPCPNCGWDSFAPSNCSVEMRDDIDCTWTELQRDMGPNGEALYCDVTGTRRKLLSRIKEIGPIYNYHMFANQLTTHQDKLRHETFDGETEIDITSDWAAGYTMMHRNVRTAPRITSMLH